jgi:hypothetical protein
MNISSKSISYYLSGYGYKFLNEQEVIIGCGFVWDWFSLRNQKVSDMKNIYHVEL